MKVEEQNIKSQKRMNLHMPEIIQLSTQVPTVSCILTLIGAETIISFGDFYKICGCMENQLNYWLVNVRDSSEPKLESFQNWFSVIKPLAIK